MGRASRRDLFPAPVSKFPSFIFLSLKSCHCTCDRVDQHGAKQVMSPLCLLVKLMSVQFPDALLMWISARCLLHPLPSVANTDSLSLNLNNKNKHYPEDLSFTRLLSLCIFTVPIFAFSSGELLLSLLLFGTFETQYWYLSHDVLELTISLSLLPCAGMTGMSHHF